MTFLESIEEQKKKNIQTYSNDVNRLFSDYEQERQTTEDYNGRQILELLQNADDAQSKKVQIELDTDKQLLVISNVGEPFSKEGFESLMLAHNSSKRNKKLYIGNKGLGFRSVLNWADKIEIISNNSKVSFSQEIVTNCVEKELAEKLDEIAELKIKKQYEETAFTYPILALPSIQEERQISEWTTRITIQYKQNFLEDIKKQIATLSPEVLLFVRNMESLKIVEDGKVKEFSSESEPQENFCNLYLFSKNQEGENKDWLYRVFKRSGKLPLEYQESNKYKESLHYEIAVAIGDDFEIEKNYLYSFFKTDIEIPLPSVIHGSFDLNSSRTAINDTKVNEYILRKIVRELLYISLFIRKDSKTTTWNSFELLRLRHSILLDKFGEFEGLLNQYLSKTSILPCVDDAYRPLSDVIYYSDEMSFLVAEKYGKYFGQILKAKRNGKSWKDVNLKAGKIYKEEYFWNTFDRICKEDAFSIDTRVDLIKLLSDLIERGQLTNNNNYKISILVDDEEKLIDKGSLIYTPAPYKINKPTYMDVQFVGKVFYKKLLQIFGISGEHQDRQLCSKIGSFVNLKPYDLAELTPIIIRRCNEVLKETRNPLMIIRETIDVLYHNHLLSRTISSGSETKYEGVLLVNRKKELAIPGNLYFSKTYENGLLTESIYGDIISDSEYLVDKDFWGIKDDEQLEDFFILLGVSKRIKYEEFQLSETEKEYYNPLLEGCNEYKLYQNHGPHNSVYRLVDLEKVMLLSASKILLLLFSEYELKQQLSTPHLQFNRSGYKGKYDVQTDCSYMAFQLKSIFEKVVVNIDDKDIDSLIDEKSKLDYDFLEQNGIKKENADEILRHLYAKKDLTELDTALIYSMLTRVPPKFPNGRNVQKIYSRILDILKSREIKELPQGLFLGCHVGDKFEYKLCKDIYYYDDAVLPKSILREIPTLAMGQRAGCDNVVRVFGVRKLTAGALEIQENAIDVNEPMSAFFDEYIKRRWAFILAYRLVGVNESKKKDEETRHLINLKIYLISSGKFSFNGKEQDFEEFDFVSKGDDAYIRVPNINFDSLLKKLEFLDACAEVLMMQFRLEDIKLKKTFRDVINSDVEKTEKEICSDYSQDYLRECKELLGLNETPETIFWNKILESKSLPIFVDSKEKNIAKYVEETLSIVLPPNYSDVVFFDVRNDAFIDLLRMVKDVIGVLLSHCLNEDGLVEYHKEHITNLVLDYIDKFTSLLWKKTNALPIEEKQPRIDFQDNVRKFRYCAQNIDFSDHAFKLDVDYNDIIVKYAREIFDVDLAQEDDNPHHVKYQYDLPEGNETALPKDLASLVFFEGYDSEFNRFFGDSEKETTEKMEPADSGALPNIGSNPVISVSVASIIPAEERSGSSMESRRAGSRTPHNYSPSTEQTKREHGKSAQDSVVRWLKENNYLYHERYSTSQSVDKDDGAHYDIEYKLNGTTEWRFLEVKHVSNDTFDISNGEIEFACLSENKKKYDLALVKDGEVHPVIAPFANESKRSFIEKFRATETGYTVKFKMIVEERD